MDDTISRQVAIDAIAKMMPQSFTPDGSHPADKEIFIAQEAFADCIKTIEILPPAQPERKTGRWLPDNGCGGGYWVCSSCKNPTEAFAANVLYKHCPFCGARMEEK